MSDVYCATHAAAPLSDQVLFKSSTRMQKSTFAPQDGRAYKDPHLALLVKPYKNKVVKNDIACHRPPVVCGQYKGGP